MKKYSVIYADPPWNYKRKADGIIQGGAVRHYKTMKIEDIINLPIKNISDENCCLLMWATFPKLFERPGPIDVIESWGFKYKTIGFTWIKTNKNNDKPFFGIGYYTKSNAEVCLLAIKGKMKPVSNKISSAIIHPRGEHSQKPEIIKEKISDLFGDVPKIELFARQKTVGWDAWGNEVESDVKLYVDF